MTLSIQLLILTFLFLKSVAEVEVEEGEEEVVEEEEIDNNGVEMIEEEVEEGEEEVVEEVVEIKIWGE